MLWESGTKLLKTGVLWSHCVSWGSKHALHTPANTGLSPVSLKTVKDSFVRDGNELFLSFILFWWFVSPQLRNSNWHLFIKWQTVITVTHNHKQPVSQTADGWSQMQVQLSLESAVDGFSRSWDVQGPGFILTRCIYATALGRKRGIDLNIAIKRHPKCLLRGVPIRVYRL